MWIDEQVVKECHQPVLCQVWQPSSTMVVVGRSNDIERECKVLNCQTDNVPVLRRKGGGGSVILHPGCVILGIGLWVQDLFNNVFYFSKLNSSVISCLKGFLPSNQVLLQGGISDICLGDKKIAGTSLFRSRNYLLFQASFLYDARPDLMERYLAHPSKEPEYRKGRRHSDFVCSFKDLADVSFEKLRSCLSASLESQVLSHLVGHLISADSVQVKDLKSRFLSSPCDKELL